VNTFRLAETASCPASLSCYAGGTGQAIPACPFGRMDMPPGMSMELLTSPSSRAFKP